MDRKAELFRMDLERWREFGALVDRIPEGRMEEPTLNPDNWSVKDLLWHMGRWYEEAARELEKVRLGTYVERDYETERLNARFLDEGRRVDLTAVRAEWLASRNHMLEELSALSEVTPPAEEWFLESGYQHIDDHLPELRRFAGGAE